MANSKVDEIISDAPDWAQDIMKQLREIILDCGLKEDVKWGAPAYTHHGTVLGIVPLKNYVALWFFEGATLSDPANKLIASSEKTKALRQWRFEDGAQIDSALVAQYVNEAALNMEKGIKTPKSRVKVPPIPELLSEAFKKEPHLKSYFENLAPSYRRDFIDYITQAKREETRIRRLEESLKLMREGKDLMSKYRK